MSEAAEVERLAIELAEGLAGRVRPGLASEAGREHAGSAVGGDVTFAIDADAERFMRDFFAERAPQLAFYSEDHGLGGNPDASWVLVVDPIDGTRPAIAGLESACASVAAAPLADAEPTMGDVAVGCIVEIKSGDRFVAVHGEGLRPAARPPRRVGIERMLWTYGLRGRPAVPTATVLEELIDASSVGGGSFDLGSATFDMTRIVTGQLDAYVEPGPRMVDEVPGMRERFEALGGGQILNNAPYDLAAAALCVTEGGGIVTDARGRSLDDRPLLGSGHEHQMSCVAASSAELHAAIVASVDAGIERLRAASEPATG